MGVFSNWPLSLRVEPRLDGFVVAHDPRNPPAWRGRKFSYERMGRVHNRSGLPVLVDERGAPVKEGVRDVCLSCRDTVTSRVMRRAQVRNFKRRLADGTLDQVVKRTPSELKGWQLALIGLIMAAWCGFIWWEVVRQYFSVAPSHRITSDLIVMSTMGLIPTLMCAVLLWLVGTLGRNTCNVFRVTGGGITPLEGEFSGVAFERSSLTGYRARTHCVQVTSARGTLRFSWERGPFWMWLGAEHEERERERRGMRRCVWYMAVGGLVVVACGVLLSADQPPELRYKPLYSLLPMGVMVLGLYKFSQGWVPPQPLRGWDNRNERRRRKRAREAAAADAER